MESGIENYAVNLIEKMNNPFEKTSNKQNKQMNKEISSEI